MTSLLLAAVLSGPVALEPDPTVTLSLKSAKVVVGKTIEGKVSLTFADGLHGYQNPPSEEYQIPVKVSIADKKFKLVSAKYPAGIDMVLGGESKPSKVYEGTVEIPVKLKMVKPTPGSYTVEVVVDYQQCNESSCFPPGSMKAKAKLTLTKKASKQ